MPVVVPAAPVEQPVPELAAPAGSVAPDRPEPAVLAGFVAPVGLVALPKQMTRC